MAGFGRRYYDNYLRIAALSLLGILVLAALFLFHAVLLPFALAMFLAYLLSPVIDFLHRLRIRQWPVPRGAAILVVYAVILGLMVLSGFYLFPRFTVEVNRMIKTLPGVLKEVETTMVVPLEERVNRLLAEVFPPPSLEELNGEFENGIDPPPPRQASDPNALQPSPPPPWQTLVKDYTYLVRQLDETRWEILPQRRVEQRPGNHRDPFRFNRQVSHAFAQFRAGFEENIIELIQLGRKAVRVLLTSFFGLFLTLMISGFLLLEPSRIWNFIRSLVPARHAHAFDDLLGRLDHGLSGVVRGQALICLINGVLTGIGVAVLGIPFVVTLSVLAAAFSLIPIFGVLISSIPILLMALTVSFSTVLLALGWILAIHFLEGNFLNPKILGDSSKIHPVLIVFALVVGEHFAGVVGALLAVPIFSLIQNSFLFIKTQAEVQDIAS